MLLAWICDVTKIPEALLAFQLLPLNLCEHRRHDLDIKGDCKTLTAKMAQDDTSNVTRKQRRDCVQDCELNMEDFKLDSFEEP